ncbi:helicase RepA family protein [Loktanella sp. R86503]|uniref:helicase RepA family protein n=1 Tax=Loktanella sp. R86503 TaxID=3093847 RepID=UPI0036DE122B
MGAQDAAHLSAFPRAETQIKKIQLTGRAADLAFQMVPLSAIKPVLDACELVAKWLDRGSFSVVYGDSNVGKTFFALDLSMHIAAGQNWHGHRVPGNEEYAGPVVYVAGEGGGGINNRIDAIRQAKPHLMEHTEQNGDFLLLPTALDLCGDGDAIALNAALDSLQTPPSLVVIDTLARAFGGGDENTARDMGAFVRNIDYLRANNECHIMVIHHSGKDSSKGARGSGSLRAATDTEIELTRDGSVILAETKKQRDKVGGAVFAFTLKTVVIGLNTHGENVESAVIEPTEAPAKRAPRLKGQALIAMQAFGDALADHGVSKSGEAFPSNRQCVSLDHWREYCDRHKLTDGESASAARQAFGRAWKGLQERGLIRVLDDHAWRCDESDSKRDKA